MTRQSAVLIVLLLFCGGCDVFGGKNSTVRVNGTVINRSTGEPVRGLSVVMKVGSGGGGFSDGGYRVVASDRTDSRGRYRLHADLGDGNMVTVYLNEEPYDPAYFTFNYSLVAGEHLEKRTELYQTTTLRARADISEPLREGDRYCLYLEHIGACGSSQTRQATDARAKGNAYNRVRLVGTVAGKPVQRVDSVYCPVGEVTEYTITY